MSRGPRGGDGPSAPVVIERAGGGLTRVVRDRSGSRRALRGIVREAAERVKADQVSIWRFGAGGVPVRCLTRFHGTTRLHDDDIAYADDFGRAAARLLDGLSILVVNDVFAGPDPAEGLREYLDTTGVHALLAVPIRPEGDLDGFVSFEMVGGARAWSRDDRTYIAEVLHRVEQHWSAIATIHEPEPIPPAVPVDEGLDEGRDPIHEEPASPTEAPSVRVERRQERSARIERLRILERTGLIGHRVATHALHRLRVQQALLALLDAEPGLGAKAAMLVADALDAVGPTVAELEGFLGSAWNGGAVAPTIELTTFVGGMASRLGRLSGAEVELLIAPSVEPVHADVDGELLALGIEELVRNAREASSSGERIRVEVRRGYDRGGRGIACIVVEDHGPGIDPAELPWIFEPWFTTRGADADGMGLAFVQAVAEGHGGWVDVHSVRDEGTRVTLNFPAAADPNDDRSPVASPKVDDASFDEKAPPLALVIEDEPLLARMVRRVLEGAGFRVRVAEGQADGGRLVREFASEAALVVTERQLDDGSLGTSYLRAARSIRPDLGGVVLDRRWRIGRAAGEEESDAVERLRESASLPDDVPLLVSPVDPARLAAEALRVAVTGDSEEAGDEASPLPGAPPGTFH